ncbi:hypothetical protein EBR25_03395 [bacterium]|nr:hypothetical protein [bacterium]
MRTCSKNFPKRITPRLYLLLLLLSAFCLTFSPIGNLSADNETSFYPIWKLLRQNEKRVFLSGYQKGIQDSRKVIQILREHIETNPESALTSLDRINQLYETADVPVESLLQELTVFYSEPENHNAPLSVAFSAAKSPTR